MCIRDRPFGHAYLWDLNSNKDSLTNEPTLGEVIGLRLICEPKD